MIRIIQILFLLILTDFYIFPFEFYFLPGYNVKMIMAVLSLPMIGIDLVKRERALIGRDFLSILLILVFISVASLLSNVVNNTSDFSFNFYFISVFVWMAAAYMVISFMRLIHGYISVQLLSNYLIGVCCLQCILAIFMVYNIDLNHAINSLVATSSSSFMGDAGDRMNGLGCALDVAGGRFAAVLVIIATLLVKETNKLTIYFYILSFFIISVIGNMIGRTTIVGVVLAIAYWLYNIMLNHKASKLYLKHLLITLCVIIPIIIILYNTNHIFQGYLRFGFEGFFSLVEKGKWEVSSNEILLNHMITFPDNFRTWIIGDGYAANPSEYDPFYIGESYHGFYKATDIGYLRFIYFFGLIGMTCMIGLFARFWSICYQRFSNLRDLATLIFLVNIIIWFKATTDLLPIFAILLLIGKEEQEEFECQFNLETQAS